MDNLNSFGEKPKDPGFKIRVDGKLPFGVFYINGQKLSIQSVRYQKLSGEIFVDISATYEKKPKWLEKTWYHIKQILFG